MTITEATAALLDALAASIFSLNLVPNDPSQAGLGAHFDPTKYTGIKGQDATIDEQYYSLIAPVMLAIDGRVMPAGFEYTLNQSNALMGRPYYWYVEGFQEFVPSELPGCEVGFVYNPPANSPDLPGDWGSYGFYPAGAYCAGICKIWAQIIRMWLAGNYPRAIAPPSQ